MLLDLQFSTHRAPRQHQCAGDARSSETWEPQLQWVRAALAPETVLQMRNLKVRGKPMTTPCIITVAITGSLPQKSDNPAVPISIAEQIESTHEAFEAGATLVMRMYARTMVRRLPTPSALDVL